MLDRFSFQRQRSQVAGKAQQQTDRPRHETREPRAQKVRTPTESC